MTVRAVVLPHPVNPEPPDTTGREAGAEAGGAQLGAVPPTVPPVAPTPCQGSAVTAAGPADHHPLQHAGRPDIHPRQAHPQRLGIPGERPEGQVRARNNPPARAPLPRGPDAPARVDRRKGLGDSLVKGPLRPARPWCALTGMG